MASPSLFNTVRVPLAQRLRPKTLDEIIGQKCVAPDSALRKMVESGKLSSIIIWGPAGTGKTTIAKVIALQGGYTFAQFNATGATVKDIRANGDSARKLEKSTVIFIDEIHRFSTSQQDVLLPYVEEGSLILIGATTENPFMSVTQALTSRSLIVSVESMSRKDLYKVLVRGVQHFHSINKNIGVAKDAADYLVNVSCGDARKVLNLLEVAVELLAESEDEITLEHVKAAAPSKFMLFGNNEHYDYASAYQGSIQASDADSAVFWLAKWLESGEDPRYIARRLLVSAAEDAFGNPECLSAAHAAYTAAANIGRPECDIVLSMATIMTARAKRDKRAAMAIWAAVKDVKDNEDVQVPKEMRDCHYPGAKELGHGAYKDGAKQSAYVGVNKKYIYED